MKEFVLVDDPEISVIVPMFNAEKFVAQTLDCLLKQTFRNFEIIIVDDGSTDGSKRVVDHFSYDRRLRYFHKENGGTGSALNLGHQHAKGRYITWCSADNLYYPIFLEVLRGALNASLKQAKPAELVYSDFHFVDANGKPIKTVTHKAPQQGVDLIEGYDVGMSFMYTKRLWEATGPYWDKICEDFHWCVRAAQHTNFGLVTAVLAGFRVHGGQITGSRQQEEKAAADECKALARELFGTIQKADIVKELNAKLGVE